MPQCHAVGPQAAPVFVIQRECVGGNAALASRLFCLHRAALRGKLFSREILILVCCLGFFFSAIS